MKKILNSLPFKLLLGVAVGIVLGLVANEAVMNVVVTIKQVLGQIITFMIAGISSWNSTSGSSRRPSTCDTIDRCGMSA